MNVFLSFFDIFDIKKNIINKNGLRIISNYYIIYRIEYTLKQFSCLVTFIES